MRQSCRGAHQRTALTSSRWRRKSSSRLSRGRANTLQKELERRRYATGSSSPSPAHTPISSRSSRRAAVSESSPLALPVYATFLVVNPYSAHQDEAIAYLEYLASQTSESDYLYYRDMTEPMVNPTIQKELDAQEALLAQLQSEEPTAEVREQMEAAQEAIADYQRALYLVSEEDIAAWQAIAESMAVLEEPLCINSDQIVKLIGRLADGNMSVDACLKGCDDDLRMVYAENQ